MGTNTLLCRHIHDLLLRMFFLLIDNVAIVTLLVCGIRTKPVLCRILFTSAVHMQLEFAKAHHHTHRKKWAWLWAREAPQNFVVPLQYLHNG